VALPASFKPAAAPGFARFRPAAAPVTANVQAEPIAPDLSNVALTVILSPEQRARIAANGFVVSPTDTKEFFEIYERARYDNVPVFVSSDSLLHTYHLLFDKVLRHAETDSFIPMLTRLDMELLKTSVAQYAALAGTPWADAARRNAAYFAVAVKLLNPDWTVPAGLADLADPDLASIAAHAGTGPSAIFPGYSIPPLRGEDWSQYVPRGHYTTSEELKRYFLAMMWHGRMTFRVVNATESQQAALLTLAYQQTTVDILPAAAVWAGIYEPTVFFVGRSDDLMPTEYADALKSAYGAVSDPKALVDDTKFAAFQQAASTLRAPQIMGMVAPKDKIDETKGLRFMGQRFVPDAFIFQQLIGRDRLLPSSLDVFAALGSAPALAHLKERGDASQPDYGPHLDTLRTTFAGYGDDSWTQNLYWSWMYSLRPLLEPVGDGYPQFMRSPVWQDKQLNTALGSYTELKRDTILYAKQVTMAERGGGPGVLPPPDPEPPQGYVEPVPLIFDRIVALAQMTIDGLDGRGLLNEEDKTDLTKIVELATRLRDMASQELRGEGLSADDYKYIRFYGANIETLALSAADGNIDKPLQAAVVADLATDATTGQVLENGVGRVFEIDVVAPINGKLVLTKGGVFSHYEFTQPMGDRLTDEAWRARLDSGGAPPLAAWTSSFLVDQNGAGPLAETIRKFNRALIFAFWYTDSGADAVNNIYDPLVDFGSVKDWLGSAELADTDAYLGQLKAAGQFVGSTLISLQFRSFDFQDADHAVVTTREIWSDELYTGSPALDHDNHANMKLAGVRKPYTLDTTYTMHRTDKAWIIDKIVLNPSAPPAWQQP
jgi:hypothetical protein